MLTSLLIPVFFLHFSTTKFLDAVFKQTNIVPHHQEYFFEGHLYELDPNLQARNFCKTTESSPLTLLSTSEQPEDVVGVRYRDRECGWLEMCHGRRRGICSSYYPKRFPVSQLGDGPISCMIPGLGASVVFDLDPSSQWGSQFTRLVAFLMPGCATVPIPSGDPSASSTSTGSWCQIPALIPVASTKSQSKRSLGQSRRWSRIKGFQGQFSPAMCC